MSFSIINTLFTRFLLFATPVSIALYLEEKKIWLFHFTELPFFFELIFSILLLDCIIYFQHRLFHKIPFLWKLHSIHHSDITLDVSSALRFHTIEIILSLCIKMLAVLIFGFSPIIVIIFEIILVVSAMFNHANIKLPTSLDHHLSKIIVTPDFHQVHHSTIHSQTNSNYWFFLSMWDKVFKSYTPHQFSVKKLWLSEARENLKFKDLFILDIEKK